MAKMWAGKGIYMCSFLKNCLLFHEKLCQRKIFFLSLPAVTLVVRISLCLPVQVVLDIIALVVVAINKKLMHSFKTTPLTLLTELICLSSCIFIWRFRIKVTCFFFCACFTTCIFLRGYWIKRTCAILLHLDSNWSDFSDWVISQIGIKHIFPTENPQQKLKRYLLQASWLHSRCTFYYLFWFFVIVWIYVPQKHQSVSQFFLSASLFIVHRPRT